ncbi:T9SS type B sorting domain-containing protein [Chryseobacterium caseinilyticum]|uniref:Gliding motility-associated C-terminal domain-containing protein n=1 Tax=Chryseobacterium caseinilyticum TaxID=2771428 RepID=A0ABR8ZG00_9FLAO|nr:gliding motility-associated C-terminal domain-containing protein [Chryseobacterium caseinilyticum]MBD8083728.1 gliding motility-associated C-terminal domain-containing protein [Chryseobacterium caseinilyticum]
MKKFLLSIFTFICLVVNAQLDTDHWFAPMALRQNPNQLQSFLYLSTNESSPFSVQIFNNNTLFTTVQISKGNPAQVSIPTDFMSTNNPTKILTPNNMGIYVKGTKKFFANYRFSLPSHAEIITSKGLAGLGKKFYVAMAPITTPQTFVNSTIGVIATEDSTNVVLSGYNPNVVFSDGSSSPTKTFTLNKGESYIIEALSTTSPFNSNGLVGAKLEATKPVSLTNGNFNGIYTFGFVGNSDILMDQSVPTDRLGKDFVVVKGNGDAYSDMESVLLLATEDNTTYTINGISLGLTLNAGEYQLLSNFYTHQGNGHYNLSVSSSKNIYLYQFLAGAYGPAENATGGMNFIPPLSCFMPNKVDEIGFINQIGSNTYNAKLNIITQAGATVTVNNASIPTTNGPYLITGNPDWVTYSIPNISGNITVNSTKSVTAGIAAGSGAVGYGGYFAGFSSVPVIAKTGDCYVGNLLQVDNSYDSYQWFLNGVLIPGANTYSINPELYGSGNYTCSVTKNNCETKLTPVYTYTVCPPITNLTYNIGSCNSKLIIPAFTTSNQSVSPTLTTIVSSPSLGTATVNPLNGQITYTPNSGLTSDAIDVFAYYIEGTGTPADFEYFKITVNIDVLQINNAALSICSNASDATFDLTAAVVTSDAGTTSSYFSDAALTSPIAIPTTYTSASGIVYVKVTSSFGCSKTAQINLNVNPSPNINTSNFNADICDDDSDGTININFATVTPQIVTNSGSFITKYYLSQTDASAGNNNTLPVNWSYTANTTVFVRVESSNGCSPAFGKIDFKIIAKIHLLTPTYVLQICDTDNNGSETVDLNNYKNIFTLDPTTAVTFHSTLADAQTGMNTIPAVQIINGGTTGIFYLRFTNSTQCYQTGNLAIEVKMLPNINVANFNANICDDNLDGILNVNFNTVTSQIVANSANFTVRYYLSQTDANAGNNNTLPTNWTYTVNTIVYVRVDGSSTCPTAFGQINFTIGNKITLITNNLNTQVCDNDINGSETVNLNDYKNQFTTDPAVTLTFHSTLTNAQAGTNAIAAQQVVTNSGIYFIRFISNNACPNTATLRINLKSGRKSDTLRDQVVCSGEKATLNAGVGFTSYLWSNGATTQSITVGEGIYFVDLGFNGCIYRQQVKITTAPTPVITSIQVTASNATINVIGGTPPYQFSLNGIDYQSSNTFSGLTRGPHTVYVLSADGCQPVISEFLILNLVNAITPDGDGHNDILNYSDLRLKQNVTIEVIDRYGAPVYKSLDKNYIWDGKSGGRTLSTGTYWYILKWTEPDTKLPVSHSGWILIKNRN